MGPDPTGPPSPEAPQETSDEPVQPDQWEWTWQQVEDLVAEYTAGTELSYMIKRGIITGHSWTAIHAQIRRLKDNNVIIENAQGGYMAIWDSRVPEDKRESIADVHQRIATHASWSQEEVPR
jgi:hypothetical protein